MQKEIKTIGTKVVFAWIFSLFFILAGIGLLWGAHILSGIFFILAGIIILPLFEKMLEEKAKIKLTIGLKVVFVLVLIIIAGVIMTHSKEFQENELKIGYISLVEADGTCNDKGPVPLFSEPNRPFLGANYILPESDDFCNGGVRILIEEQQGDWIKIIVSDDRYSGTKYGWVLSNLIRTK